MSIFAQSFEKGGEKRERRTGKGERLARLQPRLCFWEEADKQVCDLHNPGLSVRLNTDADSGKEHHLYHFCV